MNKASPAFGIGLVIGLLIAATTAAAGPVAMFALGPARGAAEGAPDSLAPEETAVVEFQYTIYCAAAAFTSAPEEVTVAFSVTASEGLEVDEPADQNVGTIVCAQTPQATYSVTFPIKAIGNTTQIETIIVQAEILQGTVYAGSGPTTQEYRIAIIAEDDPEPAPVMATEGQKATPGPGAVVVPLLLVFGAALRRRTGP
jgi:hypothetical protein